MKSGKSKSVNRRTPFAHISNGGKSSGNTKEKIQVDRGDGGCLDRLLLARSELSCLVNKIDEIVAQALEQNVRSKSAIEEIESLTNLLSGMHSSLKPWVLRLSQAQTRNKIEVQFCHSLERSSTSADGNGNSSPSIKDELKMDMIISPSPLVAWQAGGCRFMKERQLFLLTPMSTKPKEKPSQCPGSSKIKAINLDMKDSRDTSLLCPSATTSMKRCKVPKTVTKDCTVKENNMNESRLKISAQLIPTFNSSQQNYGLKPQAYQKNNCNFSDRHSVRGVSDAFSLKTKLLIGPSSPHNFLNRRRNVDEALEWFLSPPKTCTIMNPDHGRYHSTVKDKSLGLSIQELSAKDPIHEQDDKKVPKHLQESNKACDGIVIDSEEQLFDLHLCNFTKKGDLDESLEWFLSPPKTCTLMESFDTKISLSSAFVDDSVLRSRRPGETTLKKELWSKFQAASLGRFSYRDSILKKEARKDFMDMLEEAS